MAVEPGYVMDWIAAWIPLLVIIISFSLYYGFKGGTVPTLVATVLSFGVPFLVMKLWLTLDFWPWLLLYVFLSWIACWGANFALKRRPRRS